MTTVHPHWARWALAPAAAAFVLDQASKWWLQALVPNGAFDNAHPASWPAWLTWHHNTGVAWGLMNEMPWLVGALTLVLIPILIAMWWRHWRGSAIENCAWGLVLGGALGNAVDRALIHTGTLRGVRDFIHVDLGFWPFAPWPTFNIADAAICIGVALLIVSGFRRPASAPAPESQPR